VSIDASVTEAVNRPAGPELVHAKEGSCRS
jgi:hypothetical protein